MLDVGCGAKSRFCIYRKRFDVTAIDISENAIKASRELRGLKNCKSFGCFGFKDFREIRHYSSFDERNWNFLVK